MTDWETTKIKADVKADAADLDATYTEVMQAGIRSLEGKGPVPEPNTIGPDPDELVDTIATEIDTAAFDGGMSDEKADRILRRLDDLETEFNALREGLQR